MSERRRRGHADDLAGAGRRPVARPRPGARREAGAAVPRRRPRADDAAPTSKDFTVQEVVERSGQSLRSFYQYFAGKYELLLALFEESVRSTAEHLADGRRARSTTRSSGSTRFLVEYYRICHADPEGRGEQEAPAPAHRRVRPAAAHRAPEGGVAGLRAAGGAARGSCSTTPPPPAPSAPGSTTAASPACCSRRSCSTPSPPRSAARSVRPDAGEPPRSCGASCSTASAPAPAPDTPRLRLRLRAAPPRCPAIPATPAAHQGPLMSGLAGTPAPVTSVAHHGPLMSRLAGAAPAVRVSSASARDLCRSTVLRSLYLYGNHVLSWREPVIALDDLNPEMSR